MHRKQMRALLRSHRSQPSATQANRWSAAVLASIVTFLITVFGFGISAFGFWAKLRQTDDLRVLITSSAPLITTETDRVGFTQPISLTYINSGNRQARISNLGLVALKYNDTRTPADESCDAGEPDTKIYPRFDFSSIVIKPGEITDIRDLKYTFGLLSKPLGEQGIVFPNILRLTANDSLLVCLQQRVVTPDSYVVSLSKALWLLRSRDGDFKFLFDQGKPIVVKKTITYFD
ncbi:hypothetical protein [Bradyrhizobium sp. CCBAU 11357]|uniref:hypothetical protein n=1 Tax=Bradyrhizobium sp. CCBAU 11357 TaxID=1630808 RepID=UPI0023025EDF|nr:hypothetical protein [Bradyrhizobium sp. CCBAU 11357]